MNKEKTFPLKIVSSTQAVLKEQVHKHISGEQTKVRVVYALDSTLSKVEPLVIEEGVVTHLKEDTNNPNNSETALQVKPDPTIALFFSLSDLTYICEHTIVLEGTNMVKNTIKLYIPNKIDKTKLICKDVTLLIPLQSRNTLASKYLDYSLSRT